MRRLPLIIFLLFFTLCLIDSKSGALAQSSKGYTPPDVTISATIGKPMLNLWGYAPANSSVSATGIRVSASTIADETGYFEFFNISLPTAEYPDEEHFIEVCLLATDITGISTQPTCIPPIDTSGLEYTIGPVNLSPTLLLEDAAFYKGDQSKALGYTTPNTDVEVYLAREKSGDGFLDIVKEAMAYYIPTYQTISDESGYFEFNLPADSEDSWKIFTASKILGENSPKSNTLNFSIKSPFYTIIEALLNLLSLLYPYRYYLLVLLQLIVIGLLFVKYKKTRTSQKKQKPSGE